MPSKATAEFKLSITRALGDQLADTLDRLEPEPLTTEILKKVQERPGVYELFVGAQRVYVGKAAGSLSERLTQHWRKLSGRTNIDLDDVRFVCVYVDEDLDAAAPEKLLIKKYRAIGDVPWNTNGFGSKDPGKERDTTLVKANHFDAGHPIDLDFRLPISGEMLPIGGEESAKKVLDQIKKGLPYNFRYDTSAEGKREYADITIPFTRREMPAMDIFRHLIDYFPGWQITALPGYVIAYPEARDYKSALVWWRNDASLGVSETIGPRQLGKAAPIKDDD